MMMMIRKPPFIKAQSYLESTGFLESITTASRLPLNEVDVSAFHREWSMDELTVETTPFRKPTVAVYWHGILLGIGEGKSDKAAKLSAIKQALGTLDRMREKGVAVGAVFQTGAEGLMCRAASHVLHSTYRCVTCLAVEEVMVDM